MAQVQKRTVSLPAQQAGYADSLVANGSYASVSEVVRAGLRALQERDAVIDRWLSSELANTVHAMRADPSRALPADAVFKTLRSHQAKHLKSQPTLKANVS
jgi:antitoxin ParD1/3/4